METYTPITEAQELKLALAVIESLEGLSVIDAQSVLSKARSLAFMSTKINFKDSNIGQEWHQELRQMTASGSSILEQNHQYSDQMKKSPSASAPTQSSERTSGPGSFESL